MALRALLRKLARMALGQRKRCVTAESAYWSTNACKPARVISAGFREPKKWLLSSLITSMSRKEPSRKEPFKLRCSWVISVAWRLVPVMQADKNKMRASFAMGYSSMLEIADTILEMEK